jgi:hypothetical protein
MNNRNWTWLDNVELTDDEMDRRTPAIDDLAQRWNAIHNTREERYFRRQAAYENPGEYDEPDFDSDGEAEAFNLRRQVASDLEFDHEEAILRKMEELGARMMRPYEHWNEDERLMSYLERDY